jgi:hypothetical protein
MPETDRGFVKVCQKTQNAFWQGLPDGSAAVASPTEPVKLPQKKA